jgi:outer membrane protein assembly factor BamB
MIAPNIRQRAGLSVLCVSLVTACAAGSSVPTARTTPTASAASPTSAVAGLPSSGAAGPPSSSAAGHLVTVDALTGRQRWRAQLPMATVSAPLVAGDLLVVGGTDDCRGSRITVAGVRVSTGHVVWHSSVGAVMPCDYSQRVLLAGDIVLAGGSLGASGDAQVSCPPTSSARPSANQTASLVGLDAATGRQRWRYSGAANLVLAASADVVFTWASESSCLVGLDSRTGRIRWSRTLPVISPTVATGPAGTFVEGQRAGASEGLLRIDPTTGVTMWSRALPHGGLGGPLALTREVSTAVQIETGGMPPPSPGGPSAFPVASVPPTTETYWVITWDPATGRELWRVPESGLGQMYVTGGAGPVLVSYASQEGVAALDPRTGHRLWMSPADQGAGQSTVTDGTTVLISSGSSVSALKAADGIVRWSMATHAIAGALGGSSTYLAGARHSPQPEPRRVTGRPDPAAVLHSGRSTARSAVLQRGSSGRRMRLRTRP